MPGAQRKYISFYVEWIGLIIRVHGEQGSMRPGVVSLSLLRESLPSFSGEWMFFPEILLPVGEITGESEVTKIRLS